MKPTHCFLFLCSVYALCVSSEVLWLQRTSSLSRRDQPKLSKVLTVRSGATFNLSDFINQKPAEVLNITDVIVFTSIGNTFLDKKKRLTIARNATVGDVKVQLSTKFPGSPPVSLQRLFHSGRFLNDTEVIGSLSAISPLPLVLDMISGTSAYNRTLSVSQSLEAYVSTIVHQAYLGSKIHHLSSGTTTENSSTELETKFYAQLWRTVNDSVYEKYLDEIVLALEAEKDPAVESTDTAPWRGSGDVASRVSPLAAAVAKEFDLNWRGLRSFLYYTAIILVRGLISILMMC